MFNARLGLIAALVCAPIFSFGCSTIKGAPEKIYEVSEQTLRSKILAARDNYLTPDNSEAQRQRYRNEYIYYRMQAIDQAFIDYINDVGAQDRGFSLASSLALIGVGAAGTVVSEGASQLLSAASAGIAGSQQAYDKELLFDRTSAALISAMRKRRAETKLIILQKLPRADSGYSLIEAESDLLAYEEAGRLDAAIADVVEATAAAANKAEQQLLLETRVMILDSDLAEHVVNSINDLTVEEAKALAQDPPHDYPEETLAFHRRGTLADVLGDDETTKGYLKDLVLNTPDQSIMQAWIVRLNEIEAARDQPAAEEASFDRAAPALASTEGVDDATAQRITAAEISNLTRGELAEIQSILGLEGRNVDGIWGKESQSRFELSAQNNLAGLKPADTILTAEAIARIQASSPER